MKFTEEVLLFSVEKAQLLGVVALPDQGLDVGVLVVVGGPQYRVGSHRQFLLLSRFLAGEGYPCMCFDYRGMGDSDGVARSFEFVSEDIRAAIDAFQSARPSLKRIVLWGLCDAASASLLYLEAFNDSRIAGLVLLNPWVRSEASLAQTQIKHYYGQRLLQQEFWAKLLSGKMHLTRSICELAEALLLARRKKSLAGSRARSFQERMAAGLESFTGRVLLLLSGQDYTAKEFLEFAGADPSWRVLLRSQQI